MKISLVFEPDPSLGVDPLDDHAETRSLGLFIDTSEEDVLLLRRRFGEQYEDGSLTEIWASGVWENIGPEQITAVLDGLATL